ncbi:MAG: hypothetical protein ACRDPK_20570 [Carbonactinosporaceae bacterium]
MEAVIAALYAAPPAEFVAARDSEVRAARERGDRDAARLLAGLRRPTVSAWLVNLLYQQERAAVEELLGIGEELTEASQRLSGPALQRLSAQRSQVVQTLVGTARRLAADAGVRVSADVAYEVQTTLGAAVADTGVADLVRSGRMLRAVSYAGFGPEPPFGAEPPADAEPRAGRAPQKPAGRVRERGADRQAARRRAAQQDVDDVQAAVDEAGRRRTERQAALAQARELHDRLAADHEALLAQVADLERRQDLAARRMTTAQRDHERAASRHDQTRRRLDEARQHLDRLD